MISAIAELTDLTTAQATRAVLKSPAGEIELAKRNEHWEIVKPLQARGRRPEDR